MTPYPKYENAFTSTDLRGRVYLTIFKPDDLHCHFTVWIGEVDTEDVPDTDGIPFIHGTINWDGDSWFDLDGIIEVYRPSDLSAFNDFLCGIFKKALTMIEYVDTRLLEED